MTHTNANISEKNCSEIYFLNRSIEMASKTNWRQKEKEKFTKREKKIITEMKREANKNFANERLAHFRVM